MEKSKQYSRSDLRRAFEELLELMSKYPNLKELKKHITLNTKILLCDEKITVSKLLGLFWNCTDILPSMAYQQIQDYAKSGEKVSQTYAAAARTLKRFFS